MKTIFLIAVASFGIFALWGCGKTSDNTNSAATAKGTKNEAPAKNIMKPSDVNPDKPVQIADLVDSVAADKDGWKGKEVVVTGYVSGTSGSTDHLLLTMISDQTVTNNRDISCALQGVKSADVFTKTIEVKGKISSSNTDSDFKSVNLDPCELKK